MARPLRICYEGAVYHVTIRGNERRAIFLSTEDHERDPLLIPLDLHSQRERNAGKGKGGTR